MSSKEMELLLKGWSLTTAEILYRMPDHLDLIQSFTWQEYDIAPRFPRLRGFLDFWRHKIEGPIHMVRLAHHPIVGPAEFRPVGTEWRLH